MTLAFIWCCDTLRRSTPSDVWGSIGVYKSSWVTKAVAWLLKLLGFDIRVEYESNPEKSESVIRSFNKVVKGNLSCRGLMRNE